jgi:hypothetical protein
LVDCRSSKVLRLAPLACCGDRHLALNGTASIGTLGIIRKTMPLSISEKFGFHRQLVDIG